MSDCLWGLVDGVNEHGLVLSLTFGGRRAAGDGFGIPLILRYVLQTATSTSEAVTLLSRLPTHMAYNVLVLDGEGDHALVELAPDRPARVSEETLSTNHQADNDWPEYAERTRTFERAEFLRARRNDDENAGRFVEHFADDPLYSSRFEEAFGTLYTAVYRPRGRRAEYIWPGFLSRQSIDEFREGEAHIVYGDGRLEVDEVTVSAETGTGDDWRRFVAHVPEEWRTHLPAFLHGALR